MSTCTIDMSSTEANMSEFSVSADVKVYTRIDKDGNVDAAGQYVLFGSYPQDRVKEEGLIAELDKIAGVLPSNEHCGTWTSYKYYIFDENDVDFMWYQDVEYGGERYRGVYFSQYRSAETGDLESSEGTSWQDDNGYYIQHTYWFRYQPLKWLINAETDSKVWLIADKCIDSQAYRDVVWDNSYRDSTIRAWLNNEFLHIAFDDVERSYISLEKVNNYDYETGSDDVYTFDYVHLLSEDEVEKIDRPSRARWATDYALCQGAHLGTDSGMPNWWLRSPDCWFLMYAMMVDNVFCKGDTSSVDVSTISNGICPALWLQLTDIHCNNSMV